MSRSNQPASNPPNPPRGSRSQDPSSSSNPSTSQNPEESRPSVPLTRTSTIGDSPTRTRTLGQRARDVVRGGLGGLGRSPTSRRGSVDTLQEPIHQPFIFQPTATSATVQLNPQGDNTENPLYHIEGIPVYPGVPLADSSNPRSQIKKPQGTFSASMGAHYQVPSIEDEVEANHVFKRKGKEAWPEKVTLQDDNLWELEKQSDENRKEFQDFTLAANQKWREKNSQIPKVYPTKREWEEADPELRRLMFQALKMEVVSGLENSKNDLPKFTMRFFVNLTAYDEFRAHLEGTQKKAVYFPFFRLPMWGISQKHMREGLNFKEAAEAMALFMVEAEACILEIIAYTNPRLKPSLFIHKRDQIYNMAMPAWKTPDPPQPLGAELYDTSQTFQRDLPPHITERRPRRSKEVPSRYTLPAEPPNLSRIQEEPSKTYDPLDFTQFSHHHIRNVQANVASRQTGQAPRPSFMTQSHLQKGGLKNIV